MRKIVIVIGTRPELIKVAPIIVEFQKRNLRDRIIILNTAQHKDLLNPYWDLFKVQADITLDVMRDGQHLSQLTSRVIDQFQSFLDKCKHEVAAVLAQGDTTTVFGVSLVSFYNFIPFFHLEAGLRSFDLENPFPEEYNRRSASICASYHFCPTELSKSNLLQEKVDSSKIYVVGNSVLDALESIREMLGKSSFENNQLEVIRTPSGKKVLITCHRRENHGDNLKTIISVVGELARENPEMEFIWILHPNPNVYYNISNSELKNIPNVLLIDPVGYFDLIKLLSLSSIVISDSGGLQEEAPSFQVPVLVLRKKTERPEGIDAGVACLVGADREMIKAKFYNYLENGLSNIANPYGDGRTSLRVVDILTDLILSSH